MVRSSMAWRARAVSMWSRKPMPVRMVDWPVPSRLSATLIAVSPVRRSRVACRPVCVGPLSMALRSRSTPWPLRRPRRRPAGAKPQTPSSGFLTNGFQGRLPLVGSRGKPLASCLFDGARAPSEGAMSEHDPIGWHGNHHPLRQDAGRRHDGRRRAGHDGSDGGQGKRAQGAADRAGGKHPDGVRRRDRGRVHAAGAAGEQAGAFSGPARAGVRRAREGLADGTATCGGWRRCWRWPMPSGRSR